MLKVDMFAISTGASYPSVVEPFYRFGGVQGELAQVHQVVDVLEQDSVIGCGVLRYQVLGALGYRRAGGRLGGLGGGF